jgi:hypothetical protein
MVQTRLLPRIAPSFAFGGLRGYVGRVVTDVQPLLELGSAARGYVLSSWIRPSLL